MLSLKGIGLKFWAGVVIFFTVVAGVVKIYGAGKVAERQKTDAANAEIKDDQLEAAARRPHNDAELDDRLRRGEF